MKFRFSQVLFWCWVCLSVASAQAQEVYFAGFSFIGDYNQNSQRYPVAAKLIQEKNSSGINVLDAALSQELGASSRNDFVIRTDLGNTSSGNSLALAFALIEEDTEEAAWDGGVFSVYRVIGQILVFDFDEKKVIANFPVMSQWQDLTQVKKSQDEHEAMFRRIYLDHSSPAMIFKRWVEQLQNIQIKPSYSGRLQLRQVSIDEKNTPFMPSHLREGQAYQAQVAQFFEFSLSTAQNVPLIPYTKGQAVGSKMAARFANGDVFQLALPEPDYVIDLLVRPFKHVTFETDSTNQISYGSFITLSVVEPFSQTIYVKSKFKNINRVILAKGQGRENDTWHGYQNSLRTLFSKLSTQISIGDMEVLREMTKTEDIQDQFNAFLEIIEKCK